MASGAETAIIARQDSTPTNTLIFLVSLMIYGFKSIRRKVVIFMASVSAHSSEHQHGNDGWLSATMFQAELWCLVPGCAMELWVQAQLRMGSYVVSASALQKIVLIPVLRRQRRHVGKFRSCQRNSRWRSFQYYRTNSLPMLTFTMLGLGITVYTVHTVH